QAPAGRLRRFDGTPLRSPCRVGPARAAVVLAAGGAPAGPLRAGFRRTLRGLVAGWWARPGPPGGPPSAARRRASARAAAGGRAAPPAPRALRRSGGGDHRQPRLSPDGRGSGL